MTDLGVRTYDNAAVGRVVHGAGAFDSLADLLTERGARKVIIASTRSVIDGTDFIDRARAMLGARFAGLSDPIASHSPHDALEALIRLGEDTQCDAVVAIGGSSVTDAAKVASLRIAGGAPELMLRNGAIDDSGWAPVTRQVTLIHVPTTLSAGEYTNGGGYVEAGDRGKTIAVDDRHMAWAVILDPILTLATPQDLWTSSAVKAVDHAAEAIWGRASHPIGDALSVAALQKLTRFLPVTVANPDNLAARLECQLGAWMSIASMRNTSLELSHLVEHAIGAYWNLPHGITSCVGLPSSMAFMARREPAKVAAVARAFGVGTASAQPDEDIALAGARWLQRWIADLGHPTRLSALTADHAALDRIAELAMHELQFFSRVPAGGLDEVRALLEMIWHGRTD